jgi:hypothetical protein
MPSGEGDKKTSEAISCDNASFRNPCPSALGSTLVKLFGAIPEAFKANPALYTQCTDPGYRQGPAPFTLRELTWDRFWLPSFICLLRLRTSSGRDRITVMCSSIKTLIIKPIWSKVVPVVVLKQNGWPSKDAGSGISSHETLRTAEKAGEALEAHSNFFLYYRSYVRNSMKM